MVDAGQITAVASSLGGVLFKVGIVIVLVGAAGLGAWVLNKRLKYKIPVEIFSFDSSGVPHSRSDKAGIFVDSRTNHKRFWFLGKKGYSVNPDSVKLLWTRQKGLLGSKIVQKAFFVQYGEKDIRPLNINLKQNPGIHPVIGEHDLNWFISEKARWDHIIFPKKFREWLPWIGLFFVGVIFLILFVVLLNKFEVLADVATSLKEAAHATAQAKTGQAILP